MSTALRLAGMLRAVEHVNLARYRLRRDQVGVLGHIPCAVDLPLVVDLLDNVDARLWRDGVSSKLTALVVIVRAVELVCGGTVIAFWKVYFGYLEVVLSLSRRVCAEEETVNGVGFIRWSDAS